MNLIIFGPQGSGKGTQADKLSERLNLAHIETGQIFREISREKTALGKIVFGFNERKEMIPDNLTVEVLKTYLEKIPTLQGVILDSAPRTEGQIELVENLLASLGRKIDKAVYITLPYEESVARISKRYACAVCYRHFVLGKDIQSPQDVCPTCAGPIIQRGDDTPEGIAKRLDTFYQITMPVIEYYRQKGLLVEIDGNRDVEEVFEDIISKL